MLLMDPTVIEAAVQRVEEELPEGKIGAVVATIDSNGASVEVIVRLTPTTSGLQLKAVGAYHHPASGRDSIGGKIVATF